MVLCYFMQVLVDLNPSETGSLYDDFDMLPPKKIKVSKLQQLV
jgi:hypothetical protein